MKKLDPEAAAALCSEREAIENWLNPPPPPPDPVREEWQAKARERLAEIDSILLPYFFPKPKEEGTQRKTKGGFVAMLKTGLRRKIDPATLPDVLAACLKIAKREKLKVTLEDKVYTWEPKLDLTEFRNLPEIVRLEFEKAMIATPEKTKFEIAREED